MVTYLLFMVTLWLHWCYGYIFIIHGQFALLLWLLLQYSLSIYIGVMVTSSIFMVNLHQCYGYLFIIHGQLAFVLWLLLQYSWSICIVLWLLINYSWSIYGCISFMVTYSLFMVNFHLYYGYLFIIHGQFIIA